MLLVPSTNQSDVSCYTARVAAVGTVPDAFCAEWLELANDASEPNAFSEAWFVQPALLTLAQGRVVNTVEVRNAAGLLTGVMPLTLERRYGRIPVRHVTNWMHFQCFMGTPLIRRGDEIGFWTAILTLLDQNKWACGFLSISGLLEDGAVHGALKAAAAHLGRPCPTVHRTKRAALASDLDPEEYLSAHVRPKKRKELRRLGKRLSDRGALTYSILEDANEIVGWCDTFLALEAAGWKGSQGSAFANLPETANFFREVIRGAFEAGRLDFQRLNLDGRAIAMLVNFRTPPGSWSFKIAYDEDLSQFSPGVLIELENLRRVLQDQEIDWMDSCAVEDHPMINSLWGERRVIVQVSLPLSGMSRTLKFRACRAMEMTSAKLRQMMKS